MKTLRLITILVCAASLSLSAIAATSEDSARKAIVNMSVKDMPASKALNFIGASSGIQVHCAATSKNDPAVTIHLTDISAADAISLVAALANLTVTYKDDGAYLAPKQ